MDSFDHMLAAVRSDDHTAIEELVRKYEPQIRRVIRVRMRSPQLRQLIDSTDVCQSVLANFFVRARAGQFELNNSVQLKNLLFTMARNKVCDWMRKQKNGRRDVSRQVALGMDGADEFADPHGADPATEAAIRETLERVQRLLPLPLQGVAQARAEGDTWEAIAERQGVTTDAARMQFRRGVKKVTDALDPGGSDPEVF